MAITEIGGARGVLRPKEAAYWLGCSPDMLARLIAKGDLSSFKIGAARFISLAELRRFVRTRETEAAD